MTPSFRLAGVRRPDPAGPRLLARCRRRSYVQALIAENAAEIAAWVERGAAIYVCGSLEGMAPGVHAALEAALGADRLVELTEAGRYRRDVY